MTREEATRLDLLASEQWREACEIRAALRMQSDEYMDFLAKVEKARGMAVKIRLEQLVSDERMRLRDDFRAECERRRNS